MTTRYAFFDVDCLETSPSGFLRMRPRILPLKDKLRTIYGLVRDGGYPMVFTTCCSGGMLKPENRPDILFVPIDSSETEWKTRLPYQRLIYLEKKAYGDPKVNFACRAFDMFADNGNAALLVRELAVDEWIVFGNALDLCVDSAVTGILRAKGRVTFLSDCMCSSATGYGLHGTEENRLATFARWRDAGATEQTLERFLARTEAVV